MSGGGRPESLFPLFAELKALPGVGPKAAKAMAALHVATPKDLVLTLPHSVIDRSRRSSLSGAPVGSVATVEVTVGAHRPPRFKGKPYRVEVEDSETAFQLVFFRAGGDWILQQLPVGSRRVVSGRVEMFDGSLQIAHPDHIVPPDGAGDIPEAEPVYPLANGLTQRTMRQAVGEALDRVPDLDEWIDPGQLTKAGWPGFAEALRSAHAPRTPEDVSESSPARERLAYDELFAHQLTLALTWAHARSRVGRRCDGDGRHRRRALAALPYRPTAAQNRVMEEVAGDMASDRRMYRLLQGDVGSGKTLVALMALLTAAEAGGQGALMAPTEILARQHLENLRPLAEEAGVVLEILTGRDRGAEREGKLAALAAGKIQIMVGTHALFQEGVTFGDLRLAVVDEQHRFGVRQRMDLGSKGERADVLVMTATPIPRSLQLAQWGDMDVSVLDEKPPGRTPVTTSVAPMSRMDDVVERLRSAVAEGRQAYWVCPLVVESGASDLTSAEERFKSLRAALGGAVGLVHGQMTPPEKDAAMEAFAAGETRVLVATTVIEVGVDVPDASIMVIERADNFGLAQLHQLRGRVGRGAAASTCLLLYQAPLNESAERRLTTMRETEDGFRIAEVDLSLRGSGDLIGTAQSGLPRFRVADLAGRAKLMEISQSDARSLLTRDPELSGPRGKAARALLWLLEQDRAFRLKGVG